MLHRHSARRLLLIFLLSQGMVIQALLLAWNGATAVAGEIAGGSNPICYASTLASRDVGTDEPVPLKPGAHRDCLSACLTGDAGAQPVEQPELSGRPAVHVLAPERYGELLLAGLAAQAFLARGPPMLT